MLVPPIVRIRPGRPPDADAIAHVYIEAWRSAYAGLVPNAVLVRMSVGAQAREWAQQLSRRKLADSVLVADLSGHGIIGFGSCGSARHTILSHAGEIYTLYVSPEHHDRGVGRALLLSLFDALIDRGLNSAVVWVLAQNPARFTKQWVADASLRRRSDCGTPCCRRRPMDGMTSAWSVLSATSAKREGGLSSQRAAGGCMDANLRRGHGA